MTTVKPNVPKGKTFKLVSACPRCHVVGSLKKEGDHVRCVDCDHVWTITAYKSYIKNTVPVVRK